MTLPYLANQLGYHEYHQNISVVPGQTVIRAKVGYRGKSSDVLISGVTSIYAQPGQSGSENCGGDGFSGGADSADISLGHGYVGGTNGNDGEGPCGGKGTGGDISEYSFAAWTPSWGLGGSYAGNSKYWGGGGGGILIDGKGPTNYDEETGDGYGGGGGGYDNDGLEGVILLEVESV